jgi:hypothetical protein
MNEYEKIINTAIEMLRGRESVEMIAKRLSISIGEVERIKEENNL